MQPTHSLAIFILVDILFTILAWVLVRQMYKTRWKNIDPDAGAVFFVLCPFFNIVMTFMIALILCPGIKFSKFDFNRFFDIKKDRN